jgi:secondary thiamine-phosphate synthase enzyme
MQDLLTMPGAIRTGVKAHTEYLTFNTKKKRELVHLTEKVSEIVAKSGIIEGFVLVSAMHITAGVFVNDDESGLHSDIWKWLEHLAPETEDGTANSKPIDYQHHRTGEDNGHAHLKSMLVHHEVTLPITKGKLDLGPWQRVFYAEFDGQRPKRLIVKALGF